MIKLQQFLKDRGLYTRLVDGAFGPYTLAGVICLVARRQIEPALVDLATFLFAAMRDGDITTLPRIAHFIANMSHESAGFRRMEESFTYSPQRLDQVFSRVRGIDDARALLAQGAKAVASRVYAGVNGNGDEASGDGWTYRGRGPTQLTGRGNYRNMGKALGIDLEGQPGLAAGYEVAAKIAVMFWNSRGLNKLADEGHSGLIRQKINGPARLGLDDCVSMARAILSAGGVT